MRASTATATVVHPDAATDLHTATPVRAARTRRAGGRRALSLIVPVLLVAAAAVIALTQAGSRALRVEPYFDEMWRIDMIRTAHPFDHILPGVTPLPPGWVYLYRALGPAIGTDAGGYRVVAMLLWAASMAAVFVLLRELGRPLRVSRPASTVASVTAAAAALALTVLPLATNLTGYFNQYLFDVTYAAALVTCCVLIGRRRFAFPAFLVLAAASPLFVISPLALLPGTFVAACWWAWTNDARRRLARVCALVVAGAVSAVAALVVYLGLYEGLTNRGLEGFWHDELLRNAGGDPLLLGRSLDLLRVGVLGNAVAPDSAWWVVGSVALVLAFAVGVVTASRRWPWFGVVLASGWATTVVGAAVTTGPVTPVRVTLGFYWLIYVTIALGCFHGIAWLVGAMRAPAVAQVVAVAFVLVVVMVASWPHHEGATGDTFAQGLLHDLDVVADSPTHDNLVLTYHYMANVYTHDRLANRGSPDRDYVLVGRTTPDDARLFDPARVDALVNRALPDGGTLWCVIPYAAGPEDGGKACPVPPGARQVVKSTGHMAAVLGFEVPPRS